MTTTKNYYTEWIDTEASKLSLLIEKRNKEFNNILSDTKLLAFVIGEIFKKVEQEINDFIKDIPIFFNFTSLTPNLPNDYVYALNNLEQYLDIKTQIFNACKKASIYIDFECDENYLWELTYQPHIQ